MTAKGSTMRLDGYPRVCSGCGRPVVLSGQIPLWFETLIGEPSRSFHFSCRLRQKAA